jgi:hypothetical protein
MGRNDVGRRIGPSHSAAAGRSCLSPVIGRRFWQTDLLYGRRWRELFPLRHRLPAAATSVPRFIGAILTPSSFYFCVFWPGIAFFAVILPLDVPAAGPTAYQQSPPHAQVVFASGLAAR